MGYLVAIGVGLLVGYGLGRAHGGSIKGIVLAEFEKLRTDLKL